MAFSDFPLLPGFLGPGVSHDARRFPGHEEVRAWRGGPPP
jgi:hypothetical protein